MLAPPRAARFNSFKRPGDGRIVARRAPCFEPLDLPALGILRTVRMASAAAGQRRWLALEIFVDADDDLFAALDRFEPRRVRFDQLLLQVAGIDRGDRAAHLLDPLEFFRGLRFSSSTLRAISPEPSKISP